MSGQGVVIRSAELADAAAVQAIYAPIVEDTVVSFEAVAPSVEEMGRRIASAVEDHGFLVAEQAGRVVGYAYAGPHSPRAAYRLSVTVSVYVAEDARLSGVGRALYSALLGRLAERGFHAAFAGITLPNPASVALHEAVGFTPIGVFREVGYKFGRRLDVGWWQILLAER